MNGKKSKLARRTVAHLLSTHTTQLYWLDVLAKQIKSSKSRTTTGRVPHRAGVYTMVLKNFKRYYKNRRKNVLLPKGH